MSCAEYLRYQLYDELENLVEKLESGVKNFRANIVILLTSILSSLLLTYPEIPMILLKDSTTLYRITTSYKTTFILFTLMLLAAIVIVFSLTVPRVYFVGHADTRIYVNPQKGIVLPPPSPKYNLQYFAYKIYRALRDCKLAKQSRESALNIDVVDPTFMNELLLEALVRALSLANVECQDVGGFKLKDVDVTEWLRLANIIRSAGCRVRGFSPEVVLSIPRHLRVKIEKVSKGQLLRVELKRQILHHVNNCDSLPLEPLRYSQNGAHTRNRRYARFQCDARLLPSLIRFQRVDTWMAPSLRMYHDD